MKGLKIALKGLSWTLGMFELRIRQGTDIQSHTRAV